MRAKDTPFSPKNTLNAGGKLLDLSRPRVMGILNVTPDSFHSASRVPQTLPLLQQAEKMLAEGADMLDLGGYSSRPGATDISIQEELDRIIPAIRSLHAAFPEALISIDTFRAQVAEAALSEGAGMVNDISGGEADPEMFPLLARWKVPYVLMHMRGTPQNMNSLTSYHDLVNDIIDYFSLKINKLREFGVHDIVVDPGFGFAKNVQQNFVLLRRLSDFRVLQLPLLAGLSRKSLIWRTLESSPEEALNGTTVLNTLAIQGGASILRVHDVKAAVEVIELSLHYQEETA